MTIRLGLQIPNFSYGTGVEQLFPTVLAQAREAGKLRLEGKEYIVRDGDVIFFRFNV